MSKKKLKDIILKDADWTVKKIDFDSPEIQESLKWVHEQAEEALRRKEIDPAALHRVINPYRSV